MAQGAKLAAANIANIGKVSDKAMGKIVPAQRVAATIAPDFVGRLGHIRDMPCAALRVIRNSGSQRTRVSLCYGLLGSGSRFWWPGDM
ncbi:MAG: hypothetical protein OEN20_09220, partial [Gammaproteobacteria bacterium]|nr:hypothetical protein [Gammaproteobacteria bacterium]